MPRDPSPARGGGGSNPFATRFTRPGALPYLFVPGGSVENLVQRLREEGWWAQIIGPHGAGKSTLLAALAPALAAAGRRVAHCALHPGGQKWQAALADSFPWDAATQVVVDGYEQLGWWSRWRLQSRCRQARAGLLVTTHADCGLPVLIALNPDLNLVRRVVAELLADGAPIADEQLAALYDECRGNVRDILFRLYDVHRDRAG